MARMVTLQELMDRARQAADMENATGFMPDAEVISRINAAVPELHDLLVQAYGEDYFHLTQIVTFTTDKQYYELPDDFYKLMGVDIESHANSNTWVPILRHGERRRTMGEGYPSAVADYMEYRLRGTFVHFAPPPDSTRRYRMHYVHPAPVLVRIPFTQADVSAAADEITLDDHRLYSQHPVRLSVVASGTLLSGVVANTTYYAIRVDANTIKLATSAENARDGTAIDITDAGTGAQTLLSMFDGVNGWEELVVLNAAIRMSSKEESSTTDMRRERDRIFDRIKLLVENRDQGEPETIQDVQYDLLGEDALTRWPPSL